MTIRGAVVDVDGTLVRGDDPIPGSRAGLAALRDAGARPLFVSNNPTRGPAAYRDRLRSAGIDATADDVVTAGRRRSPTSARTTPTTGSSWSASPASGPSCPARGST